MFSAIDWFLIGAYLLLAFVVGVWMTRTAGRGLSSYFVADRSLPWWWLGTSMVATYFAADTPLAITGIIANDGISGNWFWWSWVFTFMTITVFFARKWRRSRVLTDVELIELRYDGRSASLLRAFKAFYLGLVVNCIILGWLFRAMSKITSPFVDWKILLGANTFDRVSSLWPSFLVFDNLNNTLTVLIIFLIVVAYSSLGGIRGVILTDLFQFVIAMVTAIWFAILAVEYVGGLEALLAQVHSLYPERAEATLRFMPHFDAKLFPFEAFLVFVAIQWWAQYYSDGSGYLAQRMNTARIPADAEKGTLWFTLANFLLRTWPWVLVGLVALVAFPLDDPARFHSLGHELGGDREMGYPILMKLILPPGLLGLTFVSLMAAFMSTVDTHINWGASYVVNDLYLRFVRPAATDRELVLVSRVGVVSLSLLAIIVATQISSIEQAWKFFVSIGAGMGLPQILRWVWWRANAWTEIVGISSAFVASLVLYTVFPDTRAEYLLFWIVAISTVAAFAATLSTPPTSEGALERFIERVTPYGFWGGRVASAGAGGDLGERVRLWVVGVTCTFSGMFGIGHLLKLNWMAGVALSLISIGTFVLMLRWMSAPDTIGATQGAEE
jgi:SSS family solute:Na+ symporter